MISITWATYIINIPKADLTLIQTTPTEIREMDLNWFRLQLKDLEDSEEGMMFPDTHKHNTEVTLGGLTFARVIEILDPYTITFEDGQYAVNLVGANSNVGDKVNVNQVSVRVNNSAGLISSPAIEYASYNNGVTIDVECENIGTLYPIGTPLKPVNNIPDALLIANTRGFNTFYVKSNMTFSGVTDGIFNKFHIIGNNERGTIITIDNVQFINSIFNYCTLQGIFTDGSNISVFNSTIGNLSNMSINAITCSLNGIIELTNTFDSNFSNCTDGIPGSGTPTILVNTCDSLGIWGYYGGIRLSNIVATHSNVSVNLDSGRLIVDNTDTEGSVVVRGIGSLVGVTSGTLVNSDGLLDKAKISEAVWDEQLINHIEIGTTGRALSFLQFVGKVWIDTINGVSGTTFPIGTQSYPVNNGTDAIEIANREGIEEFVIQGALTTSHDISNITVGGDSFLDDKLIFNHQTYFGVTFKNLYLTGFATFTNCEFINCFIEDIVGISGEMIGCMIKDSIVIEEGKRLSGTEIVAEGDFTTIDLTNTTGTEISLDVNSGYILFINSVDGCLIELNEKGGEIELDSSITGGDLYLEGIGTVHGDPIALGMNVKANHLLALETITDYVWNKTLP